MAERPWYPYAPDQQFGARAAADADALDRLLALMESTRPDPPRAGNKAPLSGLAGRTSATGASGASGGPASWRPVAEWLAGAHGGPGGLGALGGTPSTTASALDASPWVRSDG